MEINFEIENPELISVNDQYIHPVRRTKNGKYMSYFAPSPKLKKVQAYYDEVLAEKISDEQIDELNKLISQNALTGLELSIIIAMPASQIKEHDLSNYIKSLEDCVVRRTKIDDALNYKVISEKQILDLDSREWKLRISIKPYKLKKFE